MDSIYTEKRPRASVWKLQAIDTHEHTVINGTLLSGLPKLIKKDERTFSNFSKMLRSYFTRPLSGTDIQVGVGGELLPVRTDSRGNFQLEVPGREKSEIDIRLQSTGNRLPVLQSYPVFFPHREAPYMVVSDIDDTILVSHTHSLAERLKVLLFDAPADRKAVEATRLAFEMLDIEHVQFMYLSRSEINLFHLITDFLDHHNIPLGPVLLRDYVNWHSLLSAKDPRYKFRRMDWVVNAFPAKKLLLFGDDSQQDLDVFLWTAEHYRDRVHSIFIRQTGRKEKPPEEVLLERTHIPVIHYEKFSDIQGHLQYLLDEIHAAR